MIAPVFCPGCRTALPSHDGSGHPYYGASAACWDLYGRVLAREYQSPRLMGVHRLTVDAYAAQHPGQPERRTIQSIWVHLAGLYLVVERARPTDHARSVIGALAARSEAFAWLAPPPSLGAVTVADVAAAAGDDAHEDAVRRWAACVWAAWAPHHAAIAAAVDA